MRLNEVFKPLFESAYNALKDHEVKGYHEEISAYAKRKKYIYRGLDETGTPVFLGIGSRINRNSANTHSFVNTLVDEMLPEWDAYPDRLKSFICTSDKDYAEVFGMAYHVIPLDNQPIGVCPTMDFWQGFTFNQTAHTVEDLNNAMYEMFKYAQDQGLIPEEDYFPSTRMYLSAEKLEDYIKIVDRNKLIDKCDSSYRQMFGGETSLWKFLENNLGPANFDLIKYPNIPTGSHELWMTGNVLFVDANYLEENYL